MILSRRTLLAGVGAAGASTITGCEGRSHADGPVEIRYWTGWTGHELEAQRRLVEEFNRTRTHVQVRILSVAGSYQKLRIAFAGAATPDVCSAVWADELAGYAMRGVLRPLDEHLKQSGRSMDEFVPGVRRMLHYEGRPYGLAVTANTAFILYNKKLFREVGLDPERPPRTVEELDAASEACVERNADGSFKRYGMRPQDLNRWAYVFGGGWFDEGSGRITANHPRNVEALRWMASYRKKYDISRMTSFEAGFGSNASPNGPFFVGKAAMWQTGEFALEHLRRYAPGLDYGWFAFPSPPGGRENVTTAQGSVFIIPAATKYPELAWEFLDWLTRAHAIGQFCKEIANLPPLVELAKSPEFRQKPLFAFALDLARGENSFGPPPVPVWPRYKQDIARAEEFAVLGGQDPQRLLEDLQRTMTRELDRTLLEAL